MNLASAVFLAYLFVVLPFLGWRGSRRAATQPAPSRLLGYISTMFTQVVTGCLAFFAAYQNHLDLYPPSHLGLREYLIGAGALFLLLSAFFSGLKRNTISPNTKWLAPQTPAERALFLVLVAITAFVEESAYRGAAFQLLSQLLGNQVLGAIAAAIAFGLSHRIQGRNAVLGTILDGLFNQLVVYLTGTLYIMMGVHFLYDLFAGRILSVVVRYEQQKTP